MTNSTAESAAFLDEMQSLARLALRDWDLEVANLAPLKVRENAVFRLDLAGGGRAVLRVHRSGYHSDAELHSEFAWMRALEEAGVSVPRVIRSRHGRDFEVIAMPMLDDARQIDVFEWIDGRQLGSVESGISGESAAIAEQYFMIGAIAARMHNHTAGWQRPAGFRRHAWDAAGLVGEQPFWGRFWELAVLTPGQRTLLLRARAKIAGELAAYGTKSDRYGLIHADLVPENLLVDGRRVQVIDFDDAGFGWHLFELATSLYFISGDSIFPVARDALIRGYRSERELSDAELEWLPLFLAVRGTTYLGWVHTRQGSETARDLGPFLVERACAAAEEYLAAAGPPTSPIGTNHEDNDMATFTLTIGGKPAATANTFNVLNPADETVVAACPEGTTALVDEAVACARRALPPWAALPDADRVAKLLAIADLIEKHHAELSELVTREQGKTQSGPGANLEVGGAAAWTRVTAGLSIPEETILDDKTGKIVLRRKPVGVVASITPWNWPLMIAVWHVMPALRVGCTVVIKPSPFTPLSTLRLVELMNQILPPGVINTVTGGAEVGNHLTNHAGIDKIVFTGSIATGKKVMGNAAHNLKRVTLELGGNDAGIVLPGTDIEPLLEKLFWGCFINAGQTCAALKRLYVHEDQHDEIVKKFSEYVAKIPVGNGLDPKNLIGPVSNKMQLDKVAAYVDDARARGATIVTGGVRPTAPGFFYPLTVIANASDDMRVVKEEQFGPVIPIVKYATVEEAITRANSLDVGLGGSVWGNDLQEAARYASRLECGTAWVNQHGALHPLAPFGGVKCSGIGVEFNVDGLKEYTTVQVVNVAR